MPRFSQTLAVLFTARGVGSLADSELVCSAVSERRCTAPKETKPQAVTAHRKEYARRFESRPVAATGVRPRADGVVGPGHSPSCPAWSMERLQEIHLRRYYRRDDVGDAESLSLGANSEQSRW